MTGQADTAAGEAGATGAHTDTKARSAESRATLESLLKAAPGRSWLPFARIIMALVAVGLVWAYIAQLDEVAIAVGEVVPQGNIKVIQHLEGGIIREIHVRDGNVVTPGDPLVSLNLGVNSMNAEELQVQLDALLLKRARLEAEAKGREPEFPPAIAERRSDLLRGEEESYAARLREHQSALKVLDEQIRQREAAVQELDASLRTLNRDLKLARQSLAMSQDLLSEGLVSKLEHLERRREVARLEGQIETIESAIPRTQASLQESRERLTEETLRFRSTASEELGQVQVEIARIRENLGMATEQVRRTEIRSPIQGVVKNLRYHTIGGVVRPGEPIMEIVPSEETLVVEAKLNPVDLGYVQLGQPAVVKVTSYEFVRYGGLDGQVSQIAADANTDEDGTPYFRVVVTTDKAYLGEAEAPLPITPGMQATVDIHTGTRSVLSYMIRPVLKLKHEAFRER